MAGAALAATPAAAYEQHGYNDGDTGVVLATSTPLLCRLPAAS